VKTNDKIDAARIDLLLGELRLSGVKLIWAALAATADKEGWPAARFLAALAEQEMVERISRKRGCLLEKPSTRSTSTPCR
jgi:DNA replication protein DnaC